MTVLGLVMTEKLRSNTYRYSCCYLTGAKKPRRWVHVLIDTPLERGYFNPRFYHGRPTSVSAQLSSQTSSTLPNLARHFPFITADSRTFLDSMALRAESLKSVNNLTDDLGGPLFRRLTTEFPKGFWAKRATKRLVPDGSTDAS
ncbi:hypothetical protein HAV15_011324 [Penicillium sp. str. |nr:hypothetical protein HAV15_011324 [Penicillium sp. str. \